MRVAEGVPGAARAAGELQRVQVPIPPDEGADPARPSAMALSSGATTSTRLASSAAESSATAVVSRAAASACSDRMLGAALPFSTWDRKGTDRPLAAATSARVARRSLRSARTTAPT